MPWSYDAMHIAALTDFNSIRHLKTRWNELVNKSGSNTVFQTYEWNESWWNAFGLKRDLIVLLVEQDNEIIGIAPLVISKKRINGIPEKVLGFIGSENFSSDYCDFIIKAGEEKALVAILEWLLANKKLWTKIDLLNFPSHSTNLHTVEKYFKNTGMHFYSEYFLEAPTCILNDPEVCRQLVNKKSLKRHYNYFKQNGELVFRHCETTEEILNYLDVFFQQHIERRALTDEPSLFINPSQKQFYTKLVKSCMPKGWMKFAVVLFNGEPIAFHFGFEYARRFVWYKPSFAPKYLKKSPGEVLLKFLLEYAIEQQLDEFDFTVGDEVFKYRFANLVRTNHRLRVFGNKLSYSLALSRRALGKIKRSIVNKTSK